jgi:hypothetical protein
VCNLHEWLALALSFNVDLLYRFLYVALMPVIFPFKLLDLLLSRYRHAEKIGARYYFHGRKPASGDSRAVAASSKPTRLATR